MCRLNVSGESWYVQCWHMEDRRGKKSIDRRLSAWSWGGFSCCSCAGNLEGAVSKYLVLYSTVIDCGEGNGLLAGCSLARPVSWIREIMLMMGLMPTPPAMKRTFLIFENSLCDIRGGGYVNAPPMRRDKGALRISDSLRQRKAAGGFDGDFCMASSRYGSSVLF